MRNIHNRMDVQIRAWFKSFLLRYCANEFPEYGGEISDIIKEQMIQGFNLSVQELLVCDEMSIKDIVKENPSFSDKLKSFKHALKLYCGNQGYI
ncbi:hypothetical protein FACS1894202_14700 [Clostridia bacterium]|nr:hypothetical protein FACS1894202_14700 [Clostridia bacterium]